MNREHIVVLKKIPVAVPTQEALRVASARTQAPTTRHVQERPTTRPNTQFHEVLFADRVPAPFRYAASVLAFLFLMNPVAVAYAEEVTPIPDAPSTQSATDTSVTDAGATPPPAPATEEIPHGVTIVLPPVAAPDAPTSTDATTSIDAPIVTSVTDSSTTTDATSTDDASTTETILGGGGGSTAPEGTTTEVGTSSTSTLEEIDLATSTDALASTTDETASTTEELVAEDANGIPIHLERQLTPEERALEKEAAEAAMHEQIKKEVQAEMRAKCVSYGDDGYYCLDEHSEKSITEKPPVERVVSETDPSTGNKQIYLVRSLPEGETRERVSDGSADNQFPNADGSLRMIVWQTLQNGRWQIAYRDGSGTGTQEFLTMNAFGNAHPVTDGRRIAWQMWRNGNWDIVMATPGATTTLSMDSTSTEDLLVGLHPGWSIELLSDSQEHDMFPKIAGNFVTWQEHAGEGWNMVIDDLATGAKRVVPSDPDATGDAPTIALLYKQRNADGAIVVRAKDLNTGDEVPLDGTSPKPATLPIPEQQGALPNGNGTSTTTTVRPEGDDASSTPPIL